MWELRNFWSRRGLDEAAGTRVFPVGHVYPQDRQEVGVNDTEGSSMWPQWGEVEGTRRGWGAGSLQLWGVRKPLDFKWEGISRWVEKTWTKSEGRWRPGGEVERRRVEVVMIGRARP